MAEAEKTVVLGSKGAFCRYWVRLGLLRASYLGYVVTTHAGGSHALAHGTHSHNAAKALHLVQHGAGIGQPLAILVADGLGSAQHCIQFLLHPLCR